MTRDDVKKAIAEKLIVTVGGRKKYFIIGMLQSDLLVHIVDVKNISSGKWIDMRELKLCV